MTAAQLACLAELAAYAAGFFSITDPKAARMFGDVAPRAQALSPGLRRDEELAHHRNELAVVHPTMAYGVNK